MNNALFSEWLRDFDPRVVGSKVILLMDNFTAHTYALAQIHPPLQSPRILFLPANGPSKTQPLDRGIIRTFKAP